jgi:segregation and condensation protein B
LARAFDVSVTEVTDAIEVLIKRYELSSSGIALNVSDEAYRMTTKPEVYEYVKSVLELESPSTLSQAALETLAIIAYRQPTTRADIERIRGVQSSSSLNVLIAKGLVFESGKLNKPGRPAAFSTTPEFLRFMGVERLTDLPSFEEFDRLAASQESDENGKTTL